MAKGSTFDNDILKLIFNGTAISSLADAPAASVASLYASLHIADPGSTGNQTTSETAYTGYGRIAVARTTGGWTVTSNAVSPVSSVTFGACTATYTSTVSFFAVGTASTGNGKLLYSGAISPTVAVASGVTPSLTTGTIISET